MNKYHAKKTVVNGITFDSKKEANRYCELRLLEKGNAIRNLQMQVKYELIPTQRMNGKVIERSCNYVADFVYAEKFTQNGKTGYRLVVEDTKGLRTTDYIIKRKLMLSRYGIVIREV